MRQSTVETSPKLTVKACARKYTLIASVSSQFPKVLNTPAKRSCRRCWGPERVGELAWGGEGGGGGALRVHVLHSPSPKDPFDARELA